MEKRLLITGGTGFIGSNLIELLGSTYECINIGRNKNEKCENIKWNLKDPLYNFNIPQVDAIIHCASIVGNKNIPKSEYIDVNLKSTLELLELSVKNNIKRFIYISSGGVYGYSEKILTEENNCYPQDIYSMSKYLSEELCRLYENKISIVILRMFFPYGNGQNGRLISSLINNILQGNKIILNKNGLPIINPIHINDVVEIIKGIIESNCRGVFNVCGNEYFSVEELCRKIALSIGINNLKLVHTESEVKNLMGSNKKICDLLNYSMKINIEKGIKMYLDSILNMF
ncbi:NAD-dependent epimerase/dehydratase family protein [Clostridium sp.]|uniref:NAD-dependent epimerase/dehydratase family protein n=1 Tax=Clostridium sp. TaxID=1506 RepID=UPI0039F4516A